MLYSPKNIPNMILYAVIKIWVYIVDKYIVLLGNVKIPYRSTYLRSKLLSIK